MDCIFCKIAAKEIPANLVYEDDAVVAFYDISPQAPTHLLIVPKEHIPSAAEIDASNSQLMARVFEVAAQLAKDHNLNDGFRLVTNSGARAGQSVAHIHFHMLAGRDFTWPPG